MAIQPRWNKMEAAILLEAVLNVEKGLEKQKDAIVRVSATLRKIAEVRGIKIDDKYRNVNGITFQFQSMEYSALGRISPTNKTGSKLFDEIVVIKNQFPNEYNVLLEQARGFLKADKTKPEDKVNKMNFRAVFKEWLLCHGKNERATDYITREFDAISDYAKDKKISVVDMWEISNPKQYQKYVHALQEYKFFRVLQKEKYKFLKNNSKIYLTFLKDGITPVERISPALPISESEFAVLDVDKKLYASFPNEVRNIYRILKLDSRHAYLTTEEIADIAKCEEATARTILSDATWSEMLGDGFVLGSNIKYHLKKTIAFSIDQAYGQDTKEDEILKKYFRRGFRPHSIMDRKRFINAYAEQFGEVLSDDEAVKHISKESFTFDDRLFLPKAVVNKQIAESIRDYVENYFAQQEILFYGKKFAKHSFLIQPTVENL